MSPRRVDESMALITELREGSLEAGYAAASARRVAEGQPSHTSTRSPLVIAFAVIVGFLLVVSAMALRSATSVVEQARGVQNTCVGPRPGQVVGRQSPVEVGGLRQGRQRIGRAAGEPAAPQADTGGRIGGGHAGSLRAWDIRVAATSREAASPVVMTMIVSSPAMVPTMPGTKP